MASQEEAVVAEKVGEFPVNGPPNTSFNSRISSVPGDIDMAESQVAVAGSVDSALIAGSTEPDAAAVDTGPAVDATEKVESWDLSEAVQEGGAPTLNKENSKPNFSSEDGPFEEQASSDSDLTASAQEHVVEKAEVEEAEGAVTEESAEDGNPKVQAEGSAEPEVVDEKVAEVVDEKVAEPVDEKVAEPVDEKVAEPVDEKVAEPDDDLATPEPESTEEKSVVVEDKPVDVEDKSVDVEEDKAVNVAEDAAQDAGVVSEELPAEVASSEGVSLNEGSAAPEPSVEEDYEVAEAVETDEVPTSVEAVPDVEEEKSEDVDDKPVDVEEKPEVVDEKPVVLEEKSVDLIPEQTSEVVASSEEVSPAAETDAPDHDVSEATTGAEAEEAAASLEGDSEAPKPTVDEGHDLSEVTMTPLIDEEAASAESSPDVVEKSVEAEPEAVSEVADPKIQDEAEQGDSEEPSVDEGHHLADVAITPLIDEEAGAASEEAAAPSPSIDVKAEPEPEEAAVSEDVNPKIQDEEESAEPTVDEGHHLSDVTVTPLIHEEEEEEEANMETSSADVEEKSVDAEPTVSEDVSSEQGDSEAPKPTVDEGHHLSDVTMTPLIHEEEEPSVESAAPSSSNDVAEKSVEAEPEAAPEPTVDEGHHLSDVTIAPLIEEEADAAPSSSDDVVERSFEAEPATAGTGSSEEDLSSQYERAEQRQREPPKITVDPGLHLSDCTFTPLIVDEAAESQEETVPAPADDDVEDKSVASKDFPSDNEDTVSSEPRRVRSETLFVPDEDVHEVVEATITGEEPPEPTSSEHVEDKTIDEDATAGSKDEDVSSEPTTSAGADDASPAASTLPATDVEERSIEINSEEIGDEAKAESGDEAKAESGDEAKAESGDDAEDVIPPFPTANVGREAVYTPAEEVHQVVEATIAPEAAEEESAEEVKEVVSRDLPSEEAQSTPETTSRDFSFNDLKEALSTSSEVKAAAEEGSSSSSSDAGTPELEVSSPPPPPPAPEVEEKEKEQAPKAYDLHEVVMELEEAAEKTLEDVKSSVVGDREASVAESVAQIVLEEREKTEDSSELISGVIQHVAQLAQDDFRADPNVLPDTVNQVFDREIASSPSNEAGSTQQPKETTSLGTKFSLFIVWCISLCASHVSSKDMPAPALKLGAEEVAAVLQQNAQGAASSKAASSV